MSKSERREAATFRHRVVTVLTAVLLAGVPVAFAQSSGAKKPLGKMTCEEFLVLEDTFKPKVVYWAAAYGKGGKPEAAVLDVEGTEKVVPIIVEECKKAPKASFWQKVKAEVKKVEKMM